MQTPSGTAVAGASIDVYNAGGVVHATIYSDDGITSTPNPLTSANDGTFGFYVADGRYDLKVSGTGITTRTFGDVEIFDATEKNAGDGTLTANTASFTTLTVTGVSTVATSTVTGNETVGGTLQVTGSTALAAVSTTQVTNTGNEILSSGKTIAWNSDIGLSRTQAGTLGVGNGTQGDTTGILLATTMTAPNLTTGASGLLTMRTVGTGLAGLSAPAAATFAIGNGTQGDFSGTLKTAVVNATTGIQINGAGAPNTFLKGNGTNYVSGSPTLASADFANQGTTTTVLHGNGAGNPSFAVVTPSDASGNTSGSGNFVLTTTPTITTPVITGTPTGTGIPTLTLKKGSGAGNYTGTNTSYADVDGTNLAYTVTIPTGWKLSVQVNAVVFITTATAAISLAILDTSVIHENQITAVLNSSIQSCLGWVITGDGASHTIKLQAKTGAGADAWNVFNDTATRCPTMTFNLSPSN